MISRRWALAVLLAAACSRSDAKPPVTAGSAAGAPFDSARPWRQPGDKIDSILPMPEYLRRFREGLATPTELEGGASSRDALARRFLAAVASQDSVALERLLVTRAEFAWLVFPDHQYARPPYELDPAIFWLQLRAGSDKGLARMQQHYGGQPLRYLGLRCQRDTVQVRTGPVAIWSPCFVRFRGNGGAEDRRMFGSLVERAGRVKILTFANDF